MRKIGTLVALFALTAGCDSGQMTKLQALDALQRSSESSRGETATSEPIEVSTDFTIGEGLAAAAEELAAWWDSQAPCTEVSTVGTVTTLDFGDLSDNCTYNGHTYAGLVDIEVQLNSLTQAEVHHGWTGFTNGDVTVDGGALVTWDWDDTLTRSVQTEHTWTDNAEGDTVDVVGAHTFGLLDPAGVDVWQGMSLEGERTWTDDSGDWVLDMSEVEFRLQDPVPQAGVWTLTSPEDKELVLTFARLDAATIEAVVTGVYGGDIVYHVTALGIEEVE